MSKLEKLKEYMRSREKPFVSDKFGEGIVVPVLIDDVLISVHVEESDMPEGFRLKAFRGLRLKPGKNPLFTLNLINSCIMCSNIYVVSKLRDVSLIHFMEFTGDGNYQEVYERIISVAHIFANKDLLNLGIFKEVTYGPEYIFDVCS